MMPWLSNDVETTLAKVLDSNLNTASKPFKCAVPDFTAVIVQGEDASKLLQGQLSADINALAEGQTTFACFCNPQGRIHAICLVSKLPSGFYLFVPDAIAEHLESSLKKYAVFYKVIIERIVKAPLLAFYADSNSNINDNLVINDQLYKIVVNKALVLIHGSEDHLSALWENQPEYLATTSEFWRLITFLEKIPVLEADQIESFLPHYLNALELGALDFKKGCYTGQEIIARMHYRGNIKKHLYKIRCETKTKPTIGTVLLSDDKKVGEIVNTLEVSETYHLALAIINDNALEQDIKLDTKNQPIIEIIDAPSE